MKIVTTSNVRMHVCMYVRTFSDEMTRRNNAIRSLKLMLRQSIGANSCGAGNIRVFDASGYSTRDFSVTPRRFTVPSFSPYTTIFLCMNMCILFFLGACFVSYTTARAPLFSIHGRRIAADGSLFTNKKSSQFEANRGFTRG